jgi:hypothetical protein
MREFIKRQVFNLNLEVCDEDGLLVTDIAPYLSCEEGPQTFAILTANLKADSEKRCHWIAPAGSCGEKPADCPVFSAVAPTADCSCSRSGAANFDVAAATVTHSNLGGVGPDKGAEDLRYSHAGTTIDGVSFDLVVTTLNANSYKVRDNSKNGHRGKFGAISSACSPSPTHFKFSFVKHGTHTPIFLSEVHMTIFDLDGDEESGVEIAASKGYKGYVTDANPSFSASRLHDGRTQFASNKGVANIPNPADPQTTTTQQRQDSVMFFYTNVADFEVTFGIKNCKFARNLFFSGASALNDRCGV